nr:MAG TPA: hypothetical protein [Caudoviricetes sp.]
MISNKRNIINNYILSWIMIYFNILSFIVGYILGA